MARKIYGSLERSVYVAELYKFFNSTLTDRRRYQAADMASYWDSFLSSGIIHTDNVPTLKVIADGSLMGVNLSVGRAVLKGHLYINTTDLFLDVDYADSEIDRFDRVVLRLDLTLPNRYIKAFVVQGTETGPPELTRAGNIYEVSLAQIRVKAGKSFVSQSDIIDERFDEELCGLASSLVTVPTDDLMEEWNQWFSNLKDETYITKSEFDNELGKSKREITNLKLKQEANDRIKNGVVFGTDFKSSFGMELDLSRAIVETALNVDDTTLKLNTTEGFEVGQEVTVYDIASHERVTITNVGIDNISTSPLINSYVQSANVARTMATIDTIAGNLSFGSWGNYQKVDVDEGAVGNLNNASDTRSMDYFNSIILCKGNIYFKVRSRATSYNGFMKRNGETNAWEQAPNIASGVLSDVVSLHTDGEKLFVFYTSGSDKMGVQIYEDDILMQDNVFSVGSEIVRNPLLGNVGVLMEGDIFHIAHTSLMGTGSHKEARLHYTKIKINSYNEVTDETREVISVGKYTSFPQLSPRVYRKGNGDLSVSVSLATTTSSGQHKSLLFTKKELSWEEELIRPENMSKPTFSYAFEQYGELYCITGESATTSKIYLYKKVDSVWSVIDTIESVNSNMSMNLTQDKTGNIFLYSEFYGEGLKEHVVNGDDTFEDMKLISSGTRFSVDHSPCLIMNASQYTLEKALISFGEQSIEGATKPVYYRGTFFAGGGESLLFNDVRFKTKPTRDIVAWIESDAGVTITDSDFNGRSMQVDVAENETQLMAEKFDDDIGEIRFTMNRESELDDLKIKRILGGTN